MQSLQEISPLGNITELGQVYTVGLPNVPNESLNQELILIGTDKSELSLEEKLISPQRI